jgi:formate hydrogenlyase subunit 4
VVLLIDFSFQAIELRAQAVIHSRKSSIIISELLDLHCCSGF